MCDEICQVLKRLGVKKPTKSFLKLVEITLREYYVEDAVNAIQCTDLLTEQLNMERGILHGSNYF